MKEGSGEEGGKNGEVVYSGEVAKWRWGDGAIGGWGDEVKG